MYFSRLIINCFQLLETIKPPSTSTGEFPIGPEQLASISREHDTAALQQYGGVCSPIIIFVSLVMFLVSHKFHAFLLNHYQVAGISNLLKTNLEKGVIGDDADLLKLRNAFGSNNYPRKKGRAFWVSFTAFGFLESVIALQLCCIVERLGKKWSYSLGHLTQI